jgi:succinate-semialdehyde dehydrogenase/glutarate-semialdehyde dehydrogenase
VGRTTGLDELAGLHDNQEVEMTIAVDQEREILASVKTDLFIGGKWRPSSSGRTFEVSDPATTNVLAAVADATAVDALAALESATEASISWAASPPRTRAELLRRAFELTIERREQFALLMTLEMGKPLTEARGEVTYAAEFLRWFSEEAVRIHGEYLLAPEGTMRILTSRRPVGPSYLITPWNFPLAMATRKIAPALAAGCTVILKPAELTPLTTHAFVALLEEVGIPAGVVNLISTSEPAAVTEPLLRDRRLRKLSFTGSTEVGRLLMSQASSNLLRLSMELGGNAPFIIFDDADLDKAIEGVMVAKMRNMGEACTSANRIYVHESKVDEFSERLAEVMSSLQVGRGTEDGVQVGPLIEAAAVEKVDALVQNAAELGARVLTGGRSFGPGHFYAPTVVRDVPVEARMAREEIFGPVAPIFTFSSEEEAVSHANDTEYGLVTYLFTQRLDRALRVIDRLETGMVGVNQGLVSNAAGPFGGVKHSGFGREGGFEGLEEYLETKYAAIALGS